MINDVDYDKNGYITFEEFLPLVTKIIHEDLYLEEEIRELFRYYDSTGNHHGLITKPLVSKVLLALNDQLRQGKKVLKNLSLISKCIYIIKFINITCKTYRHYLKGKYVLFAIPFSTLCKFSVNIHLQIYKFAKHNSTS